MMTNAVPMTGIEFDPDFAPVERSRCNTWPAVQPTGSPETFSPPQNTQNDDSTAFPHTTLACLLEDDDGCVTMLDSGTPLTDLLGANSDATPSKKGAIRRNPWGPSSYADLITQAILSAPDRKLTLSQIYDWFCKNIDYFRDKGDTNSSAGWKNSIRHNLSLHPCFIRIQNEAAGKSSWWTIDLELSKNKSRRRAISMESNKALENKRQRALARKRKFLQMLGKPVLAGSDNDLLHSFDSSLLAQLPLGGDYRPRTQSNASNYSAGRISPLDHFDPDLGVVPQNPQISPDSWPADMEFIDTRRRDSDERLLDELDEIVTQIQQAELASKQNQPQQLSQPPPRYYPPPQSYPQQQIFTQPAQQQQFSPPFPAQYHNGIAPQQMLVTKQQPVFGQSNQSLTANQMMYSQQQQMILKQRQEEAIRRTQQQPVNVLSLSEANELQRRNLLNSDALTPEQQRLLFQQQQVFQQQNQQQQQQQLYYRQQQRLHQQANVFGGGGGGGGPMTFPPPTEQQQQLQRSLSAQHQQQQSQQQYPTQPNFTASQSQAAAISSQNFIGQQSNPLPQQPKQEPQPTATTSATVKDEPQEQEELSTPNLLDMLADQFFPAETPPQPMSTN